MKDAIAREITSGQVDFIAATELASALLGDSIATNLFMVGYAWQKGLIPLSEKAIFKALELNSVAVEFNKQAFFWGRRAALDMTEVERVAGVAETRFKAKATLEEIVDYRYQDLIGYQNIAYAERYRTLVDKVAEKEQTIIGNSDQLAKTVAKALHRVMTYKDEYEVARLYTDGRFQQQLAGQFDGDYKVRFHLAPPLFSGRDPDTGHLRKRMYGSYMFALFKLMAPLKILRGTRLDLFGYTQERQTERQLISDLEQTIEQVLATLTPNKLPLAEEIIRLVTEVRGYGHIKEHNYQQYQLRLQQQLKRYQSNIAIQVEAA